MIKTKTQNNFFTMLSMEIMKGDVDKAPGKIFTFQ